MIEFVFNGTGTSSSLPSINCITNPKTTCKTCPAALTPEGIKNRRLNTSAILRKKVPNLLNGNNVNGVNGHTASDSSPMREVTIVIDVGKTFATAATQWFPKYGFRRIDAVLLTHAHADATNGLDDLRAWTLRGNIQSHIDIYCSAECLRQIQSAFPYLVSKEFATGGGDVPEFRWHIIKEGVSFSVADGAFWVTPVNVHHGFKYPTRQKAAPWTPQSSTTPQSDGKTTPSSIETIGLSAPEKTPLDCFAFIINSSIVYMSDVSYIPEEAWSILSNPPSSEDAELESRVSPISLNAEGNQPRPHRYSVFVVDVLKPRLHTSHFGIERGVEAARRLGAWRNYMVGFTDDLTHDQWVEVGEALLGKKGSSLSKDPEVQNTLKLVDRSGDPVWIRPAWDGLKLQIPEIGDDVEGMVDGY